MVACPIQWYPGSVYPSHSIGEGGPRRIQDRHVKQPGCSTRRRRPAGTLPRVQPDVMVVPPGRHKRGLGAVPLSGRKTENSAIEVKRTLKIGDLQMNVPNAGTSVNWSRS